MPVPVLLRLLKQVSLLNQSLLQCLRIGLDQLHQFFHAPLKIPEALVHLHLKCPGESHGLDLHEQIPGTAGIVGEGEDHVLAVAGGEPVAPLPQILPDAADLPGVLPQAGMAQGAEGMGHQLGQTDALGILVGVGKIVPDPGILGIHPGADLLHHGLQTAHLPAPGQIVRVAHEKPLTADGGLEGYPVDVFMKHRHRLHQQERSAHNLVAHDDTLRFGQLLLSTLAQGRENVKCRFPPAGNGTAAPGSSDPRDR